MGPDEEHQQYVFEQLARALGEEWLHTNRRLAERYWQAILALGYISPGGGASEGQDAP